MNASVAQVIKRFPWRRHSGSRGSVNERVAVWVTTKVGSMQMAYAFCLLALISLPAAIASRDLLVIIAWVAQTFIQLVLLPVIMVGSDVQARRTEATITDTHQLTIAEHEQTRQILTDLADSHQDTHALLAAVAEIVPELRAVMAAVGAITTDLTPGPGEGTAPA